MEIKDLQKKAKTLRKDIIEMIYRAKSGHPGGSLSIADILAVLYWKEMNVDPKNPKMENRDRLVLSKGHAAPALYAALIEKGFLGDEGKNLIPTLRKWHSPLQGHPDMKKLAGVEMSTGSLGQGLSAANGMALSAKIYNNDYRVYAILGDGELQEGQIWEAVMTAAHYKLDNLVAIIDYNNLQIDGKVSDVMDVAPVGEKFKAFKWNVIEIDGHNYEEIIKALDTAKTVKGKPTVLIANTIKGKGSKVMEDKANWHHKVPTEEEYAQIMADFKKAEEALQ